MLLCFGWKLADEGLHENYETEKITREASDVAEYIELFSSSAQDRHAGHS